MTDNHNSTRASGLIGGSIKFPHELIKMIGLTAAAFPGFVAGL